MTHRARISRRNILAAAAATPLAAGCEVNSADRAARWDREVDIVVVGSGTGLCAALVAAESGLRVLVLEKSDIVGGNTVVSGGVLWVPGNRIMKEAGFTDSREDALTYLRHVAQDQAADELLESFVDHGPDMLDFVQAHSEIRWSLYYSGDAAKYPTDYHPTWQGSHPGRSVCSAPRQPGQIANSGGSTLIGALLDAAQRKGVQVLTEAPALRLVAREGAAGQEVVGVEALHEGKTLRVRARRGVLVASGGFERNWEMKRHFLRGPSPYTLGSETNTGDGIRMGMAIGADLRNMNEVWGISVYKAEAERFGDVRRGASLNAQIDRGQAGTICVNRYGERFGNESADYDSSWRTYHTWENWLETGYRNLPAFLICDQASRETYSLAGAVKGQSLPDWVMVAPTLEELAAKLGIDTAGLAETVFRYNRHALLGKDPDFHRGESAYDTSGGQRKTLAPLLTPPYYGAEISPADIGTCGGLRVNGLAQVVDVFDRPIARLYASGNTAGIGGPGALYGGFGGTLGPAMTFAYIAGRGLSAIEAATA